MLDAQTFDVVLLDVMMPGISGLEVRKILRKRHAMADLPVIMATAKDQSSDIVEALQLGANDYVTKPLDFPVVLARVETQLSLKRAGEGPRMDTIAQRRQGLAAWAGHGGRVRTAVFSGRVGQGT
jgi:DNA-binding response OmpR family regulator